MARYSRTQLVEELKHLLDQLRDAAPWEDQFLSHNTGLRLHLLANGHVCKVRKDGSDGKKITTKSYKGMQELLIVKGLIHEILRKKK